MRSAFSAVLPLCYSVCERSTFRSHRLHGSSVFSPERLPGLSSFLPQSISSVSETTLPHLQTSLSGLPDLRSSTPAYEPEYPGSGISLPYSATACQTTSCFPQVCRLQSSPASRTGGYG